MEKSKLKSLFKSAFFIRLMLLQLSLLFQLHAAPGDVIVIFRDYRPGDDQLFSAIRKELSSQYNLYDMIITPGSKWKEFDFAIRRWNPQMIIVTGNQPAKQFADYRKKISDKSPAIPSLLILNAHTLYLQSMISNSTAIILDVPISTSLLSIQSVLRTHLKKPGIIHTKIFDRKVETAKERLSRFSLTLSNASITGRSAELPALIQESITRLMDTVHIDCLILPDDPLLFQKDLLPIWQSCLNQVNIPVISNAALPDSEANFISCTFFPDTLSTVSQIAHKIKQIKENDWKINDTTNEYCISIKKAANLKAIGRLPNISSDLFKTFDIFNE